MIFATPTVRMLTRIAISSIVFIVFALHIAANQNRHGKCWRRHSCCNQNNGNYLDYISAEQAFMAVQMLVIELDNPYLEDQLDRIADTLNNNERYRPSQFAAMLAALAEPGPETEDIDEQDK